MPRNFIVFACVSGSLVNYVTPKLIKALAFLPLIYKGSLVSRRYRLYPLAI